MSNSSFQFWNDKSKRQIFHHSSVSLRITPLQIFSSCIFYFGQKDPIKVPILRFSSALEKISQIPHVIFQTTSQCFFRFFITVQCHVRYLPCTFLGQTLYTLHKRNHSKQKFWKFRVLRSKFTKFLSYLKQQISFSSNFASLFNVMRHKSSILF